jgi:hypothetical protein
MTRERARAYARVMMTLQDAGPSKLLPSERARTRLAADALLFCADILADRSARAAFTDFEAMSSHLVDCGRWTDERADALADDVWACGPAIAAARGLAA